MAVDQLSKNNPDGTVLGQSATDKISLFGGAAKAQRANAAQTALTDNSGGTAGDTLPVISATYVQAEVRDSIASLSAKINELRAVLLDLNGMKGSA